MSRIKMLLSGYIDQAVKLSIKIGIIDHSSAGHNIMEYLIVSATSFEIKPIMDRLELDDVPIGKPMTTTLNEHQIVIMVTGVGMMHTAFSLAEILAVKKFDCVLQMGIAGAFDRNLHLGEVVNVISQGFADLGVMEDGEFYDMFDLDLMEDSGLFHDKVLFNSTAGSQQHKSLREARGVSVNCVSGMQRQIDLIYRKYNPQIEVMEGVALHYACLRLKQAYAEIRAISNYVEVRDKATWETSKAVKNLNTYLVEWLGG